MAILVWATIGIAIWHFTVFVPDRFWGGIVGAFLFGAVGAIVSGAAFQIAAQRSLGETDLVTAFAAVPGAIVAMAIAYVIGIRNEGEAEAEAG